MSWQHINVWKNNTPRNRANFAATNSPFIKFAIRPKNIPIGETQAIISKRKNVCNLFLIE